MAQIKDPWSTSCAAADKLGQDIMDRISQYHQDLAKNSPNAPSLATSIRSLMKKLNSSTASLKQALARSVAQNTISANESERRQALLDDLITQEKRLEQAFSAKSTASHNRNNLLGGASPYGTTSTNPWLDGEENDDTRVITTSDIRTQHRQVLQEQDRGLDALSKAIGRQREMAIDIAAEADIHNDILGEISEEMERADTRISRETRNMKVVLRKSRTHWCMWFLIVALMISILIVVVVPNDRTIFRLPFHYY